MSNEDKKKHIRESAIDGVLPREKILKHGGKSLEDKELLAVLLGTGNLNTNVLDLSASILEKNSLTLNDLTSFTPSDFKEISGIKDAKAARLLAAMEIANRVYNERSKAEIESFTSVEKAGKYLMGRIGDKLEERFLVLVLNSKNVPIREVAFTVRDGHYYADSNKKKIKSFYVTEDEVSKGTINQTFALPREVFRKAISVQANAIIIAHNHPSGDVTPSKEDRITTDRLVKSGDILGIKVLDHFVVSRYKYYSFREKGEM